VLIEVTEKKTIELALPFFSKDGAHTFFGITKDEVLIRVCIVPDNLSTVATYTKEYTFYNSDVVAAYKLEPITATEFYFALDKAAQILIEQCKR
jgi:hypothetical protein